MNQYPSYKKLAATSLLTAALLLGASANAEAAKYKFDLASKPLSQALVEFSEKTNVVVMYGDGVKADAITLPIAGEYSPEEALTKMLEGTGLQYKQVDDGVFVVVRNADQTSGSGVTDSKKVQGVRNDFIEEIIVTAQKREQRLIDVPMSVAALTGEQMAEAGITDLQSLSLAVPGLMVAESGSIQRRISIRGIGNVYGSSSLVGLYLDEASVTGLPANQIDLRTHDIERVEVLKGPQGTLYGEGSVGGTIRYITNDPELDSFAGNMSVDLSSTQDGDTSQEVKSVLNVPLADNLGLRLVGQYVNSGGWIDQPALDKTNINDYELFNVRGKLLWQPTDSLEIKTTAIIHRNDAGADNINEDENGNYRQAFDLPTTPSVKDDYDLYNVLVNYDLGGLELVSSTSYLDVDKKRNDSGGQCCFPTGEPGELWNIAGPSDIFTAEIFTQELRLGNSDNSSWNWTTGLFYRDAKLNIAGGGLFGVPGGVLGVTLFEFQSFQEDHSTSWAIFGETSYALTDKWEIGAGLRYFEDDRELRTARTGPFQQDTFDSLNPKFYVSYSAAENIKVYANIAKGFRSGGFNAAGEPSFDPEEVVSYEVGTKMSLNEGRMNAEVALFQSDYDDYQIIGVIPHLGLNITSNGGNAKIKGIELNVRNAVNESLELGFSGNYLDTEFVEVNVTSTSHAEGDPLDIVPKYGYTVWGSYLFTWFDNSPGFMRIDYNKQGKSHYRNRSFGPDYHDTSDIIDMLNARIGWERHNWALQLYGLNLLDENGFIGPLNIEKSSARPRPRTVGLSFDIKF